VNDTTVDHVDLERVPRAAVERGASGVHLKVDRPPVRSTRELSWLKRQVQLTPTLAALPIC
jgi:hypothetical protein